MPQSAGGITKEACPQPQQNPSGIPEGLQTLDSGQARLQELGERCRSLSAAHCNAWRNACNIM